MGYTWGTAAVAGKTGWLVQSASNAKSAQEALLLNNDGEPVEAKYYQKTDELTFEVRIPADDSTSPEIGDVFTYDGVKYYVTGITRTRSNTNYESFSLSCKRFITANLPA